MHSSSGSAVVAEESGASAGSKGGPSRPAALASWALKVRQRPNWSRRRVEPVADVPVVDDC
eukprot:10589322-Lingulodinium_polyedra.AAC.1